jgi:hypothetical protein
MFIVENAKVNSSVTISFFISLLFDFIWNLHRLQILQAAVQLQINQTSTIYFQK